MPVNSFYFSGKGTLRVFQACQVTEQSSFSGKSPPFRVVFPAMVAKINNGTSIYGALVYNLDKVNENNASVIHTNKIIQDPFDTNKISMQKALLSFEPYLTANEIYGRTQKPVVHISLNPSPEDELSDDEFSKLAADYLEKLGYKDQPYIVFKHNDIDREHIHIVTIKIDEWGKKINDSFQKRRSMDACRELEVKFGLKQITDERKEESGQFIRPIDYRQGDIKWQMSNVIRAVLSEYKFQSLGEYNALLSCFNMEAKYVKGEEKDNPYHGIVYSTTDYEGKSLGNQIKSSRIGKFAGYTALTKTILKTKEELKDQPVPYKAKSIIDKVKRESTSIEELKVKLKEHKIDILLRYNEEGRLYGVTFIDHKYRLAFNGSRIGKRFSAYGMNDWLNTLADTRQNIEPSGGGIQEKNALSGNFSPEFREMNYVSDNSFSPSMDEVFGIFHVTAGAPDPEEEEFIRKMKRKKRRDGEIIKSSLFQLSCTIPTETIQNE